ncbi:MAG: ABC transporter ATP-binding protein [Bacilli bacterium]|nr:ABC transporter ATP-binding protein [Bacilli bacterium]
MIEIKHLSVIYEKTRSNPSVVAIDDLSLEMETGKFNVIVGPSGSGKSTLLRAIAGLQPYKGDIIVDKNDYRNIHPSDRNIAFVYQEYNLYPHFTIFDNIAFPLKSRGASKQEIIKIVDEVSEELDIKYLYTRKVKELSGGQLQRVALARAMVKRPDIYLFDEPLSNISSEFREKERLIIKQTISKYQSTAIYVTHNIKEATALADKIFVLDKGQLVFSGSPMEVLKSEDSFVQELFKEV